MLGMGWSGGKNSKDRSGSSILVLSKSGTNVASALHNVQTQSIASPERTAVRYASREIPEKKKRTLWVSFSNARLNGWDFQKEFDLNLIIRKDMRNIREETHFVSFFFKCETKL